MKYYWAIRAARIKAAFLLRFQVRFESHNLASDRCSKRLTNT